MTAVPCGTRIPGRVITVPFLVLFVELLVVSYLAIMRCSLEAALGTAPVRDDLLDTIGSFLAAVLLFQRPIISVNLF